MQLLARGSAASLAAWRSRPFTPGSEGGAQPGDRRDVYERVVAHEPAGPPLREGPFRRLQAALLRFDVFDPQRIAAVLEREPLEIGDTVGVRYGIAPGLSLFFASRVIAVFDRLEREAGLHSAGFTYRTLSGHPELGEETFSVEKALSSGAVTIALRSWSRPGLWCTRLAAPLLRRVQVGASRAALEHLARVAGSERR